MISHGLAFVAGAVAMLALMIYDGVYGPISLRWKRKPDPEPEPGGGWEW